MRILVTGTAGHLGEALALTLKADGHAVVGLDIQPSPHTDIVGSITDRASVRKAMQGVQAVLHAATLHKPHVATHSRQAFVDTNISGTLSLLEEAVAAGVGAFVYTSTTSSFGDALSPPPSQPAAWITEDVVPVPKNIYGATKVAAEDLCQLFHRNQGLPVVVLKTSRFFPEDDDNPEQQRAFERANLQVIELLNRRVDILDVVTAHQCAIERASAIGFGKFIISATTPFMPEDLPRLRGQVAEVLHERVPGWEPVFGAQGWRMADDLDRVYVNARARSMLGWQPVHGFAQALRDLAAGRDFRSPLALAVGAKGYHPT